MRHSTFLDEYMVKWPIKRLPDEVPPQVKDHVGSLPQAAVITLIALKLAGVVTWL